VNKAIEASVGGSMRRRHVLAAIAAGAVVLGFDPLRKTWVRAAEAAGGCDAFDHLPDLDGTVYQDVATRDSVSTDQGNIKQLQPVAVLRPGSAEDVAKMVRFCKRHRIQIAARGQGHTTFGHSLTPGLSIEMASLSTIHSIGPDGAEVDAGVLWQDLIFAAAEAGLTPPVLTGYTKLSIGGTLSVGGVSSTFGRGVQIEHVEWLDVVTGSGVLLRCSETHRRRLFEAVLGGLGQCGIIVRAKVGLVQAPAFVRLFNLVYFDNAQLFGDMRALLARDELDDYFNLYFPYPGPGGWGAQLNAAIGYDAPADAPDASVVLRDLSQPASAATFVDIPYVAYVTRIDGVYDFYKVTYAWDSLIKPWFDVLLPDSTAEGYIAEVLPTLTPADVGTTGFMLMFPIRRSGITRPFFRIPEDDGTDFIYLFDILTSSETPGPNPAFVELMLERNRALFELARDAGGTRYPIGALEFDAADWAAQYGDSWSDFRQRKQQYDPHDLLAPGLGIFDC
jgi:cytokinin dehydrogenase